MLKKQFFISILLIVLSCQLFAQKLSFESLTCNSKNNPIAIESPQPFLSWIVKADGYNRRQTAFQVLIASKPDLLTEKDADMWNSGYVKSVQSTNVKYHGLKLLPVHKYYWKVKIWDENGNASNWSQVNTFEMGLINASNWKDAKWISLEKDMRTSKYRFREYKTGKMEESVMVTSQAAGYFRKVLNVDKEVKSARAYICGLGYYELYINGEKIGDHVLDPAPSNYDKQAYYVAYNVTKQLKTGKNAIGIILGNGFYGQNISWKSNYNSEKDLSYGVPAARLLIKVTYSDGSRSEFISDENWKVSTGPIVFDNIYGGETYDARYELNGWKFVDYSDTDWKKVKTITPDVKKISAQQMPPIRKLCELAPKRVFKSSNDKWIVDFGQNIAGWVQIKVQEKKGDVIKMIPTEALTQKGDDVFPGSTGGGANGMTQLLEYICKGEGIETWEPKFTYLGFRYVEISGISTKPSKESIKAILVATDIKQDGNFSCSDPLLNKMDTISKWTIIDNLHGIPEDCPQREKCGWLGDSYAYCEYAMYNYDMKNFYKKYMEDIHTQMRLVKGNDNSNIKYHVPTMIAPGKRTSTIAKLDWGVATIYIPWYNYLYYGDSSVVSEYYKDMKDLTNYYLSFKNDKGIIQNGMGDWCPPRWDRKGNPEAMECDPVISANAYFYDILGIMEDFAVMNEDADFEAKMKSEKKKLYTAFNTEYLKRISQTDSLWYGSQTATVMALQYKMVPKSKLEAVVNGLEYNINTIKKGHHSTGIHGNRYIYSVLSKYGKADLAYKILTTPTFPSQAYIVNYGFTTWPERQFEWNKEDELTHSLNHPMHSGFAAYFFEMLGGIKPVYNYPGFKEFTVNPIFPKEITQTTINVPTPYGNIHYSWDINNSIFSMNLHVPFNTKARLVLTKEDLKSLKINGYNWDKFQKDNNIDVIDDNVLVLGSGNYIIEKMKTGN